MFCVGQFLGFCVPRVPEDMFFLLGGKFADVVSLSSVGCSGFSFPGSLWLSFVSRAICLESLSAGDLLALGTGLELLVVLAVPGWDEGLEHASVEV